MKASVIELTGEVRFCSEKQLKMLKRVKATHRQAQQLSILNNLYHETSQSLLLFQDDVAPSKDNQMSSQAMVELREDTVMLLEKRHAGVIETLADIAAKEQTKHDRDLNILHISSILKTHGSISILLSHLASLISKRNYSKTGCVDTFDLKTLVENAKFETMLLIEHHYNYCPDIEIVLSNGSSTNTSSSITCIPSILRFTCIELLKNSASSTIEQYCSDSNIPVDTLIYSCDLENICLPPILVTISTNAEETAISIRDRGKGIPNDQPAGILDIASPSFIQHYLFPFKQAAKVEQQASYQPMTAPCKGFGCGIYMSTLYASQFGGTLRLESMGVGKGCIATISISMDLDIEDPQLDN